MDATQDYPYLSQWPEMLGPVPTHNHLVQAYALGKRRRSRRAVAVAAYLSGHYWWPDDLGVAIDGAMGTPGGAANDPRNVIKDLEARGLVTPQPKRASGGRKLWSYKLTAEGEAVVATYRRSLGIEDPVAEAAEPQAQAVDTAVPLDEQDQDKAINQEVTRMAELIQNRVKTAGQQIMRVNPLRFGPNLSDLISLLRHKWIEQSGRCNLCGGQLLPGTLNAMLQASPDRIDSGNPSYSEENTQITHLACNLAKNEHGAVQFLEWLDVVRGKTDFSATARGK